MKQRRRPSYLKPYPLRSYQFKVQVHQKQESQVHIQVHIQAHNPQFKIDLGHAE